MTTILIVCGAGASSTFLATSLRRIASHREIDLVFQAVSDNDLAARLPSVDAILLGAHLAPSFDTISALAAKHHVELALLAPTVFAPGGAEEAFELALQLAAARRPALLTPKDTPHG